MAECEMLTADMESAEKRLSMLATRANGTHYLALVTCLQLTLYLALNFLDRAIEICLEYLRRGGTSWSAHPTSDEVQREYDRIWSLLGDRKIEDLLDQPMVTRPDILDLLEVLTQIVTPAIFFDKDLCALAVCRMVNLSLEHGNSDASCFAYVWFGIVVGPRFGCYEEAFRFGQLGYDLLEKRGLKRYEARTSMCFSVVVPRTKHAHQSRGLVRHALDIACRAGDFTYAAYSFTQLVTNYLVVGDPLTKAQEEAEKGVAYAKSARVGRVVDIVRSDLQLIRSLRGLTQKLGSFNDNEFDEAEFERHLESPDLADCGFGYWTLKAQAQFFAQDYASAVDASLRAQQLLWSSPAVLEQSALRFYGALSHAALCVSASPDERQKHFEALTAHHKQLELWAKYCPDNFENRAALIGAEIARIEDRVLDAEALYEKAIRSAHANSFVHNEGVANEVAAQFYSARGFEKIANAYLHDARGCYQKWGADGKVRRFDEIYPHLNKTEVVLGTGRMIGEPVEQLDLGTVIKVSQAISVEMDLETLIDTVMRAALEHAGAVRGLLILSRDGTLRIEAEATTIGDKVLVRREEAAQSAVPQSIVNYVMRTQEFVILDDASNQGLFIADRYFSQHCSRSVLCLPLITKGKLVGLLYLENHLAPNVFISNRIAVLKLVASQAAISLENTRLYTDLKQSEAKNRRLVDANILGVVIWNAEGAILASNDAFLRMMEYDHEDVAAGRVRWRDMTPANRRDRVEFELATVLRTGTAQPFESELFRKDGSRLPVLLAGALFEEGGNEGVGFALDLSEQKRVEEAFRRSESYLAQAQRLAHIGSWVLEVPSRSALYISGEGYRIYGFDPKDGMPTWEQLFQRVHPDDRSRWQVTIDRAIAEKSDFDVEFRILPPGSPIKYIHSVGQPVRSSSGELLQFIGVAMDVTDRKRSEEALRSSEAYLMEAQTLTHTGSCAMDGTSREILYWSEEMFRLFGFDPHRGLPEWDQWLQRIHPEDRGKFKLESNKTFLERVDCDLEFRIVKPDGTVRHIHGIGHPVLSPNGELAQVVGTMVDITDRMYAEEALKRSETYLAQAQRVANIGSWVFDAVRMRPVHLSTEWHRLQDFDPKDGMPTWEQRLQRIHPEDRARYEEAFNRAIAEKSDLDAEFRILLPDSTIRYIRSVGHPVLDTLGEVTQMMGVIMDVTKSRQAEQQHERLRQELAHLSHLNRVSTIGELTASLAHEIKQPIGATVTNAQACLRFLDEDRLNLIEAREAALETTRDAMRAAEIIDRVRSLYRKEPSHQEMVDVNDLIREMIVMLRDEAKLHSVTTCTDLAEGLPKVIVDRVQLQQALMNLMLNGIEAMRDTTGELSIRSQLAEDHQVQISVADAGVGLPIGKADQIFNAFFTTKPNGTGLGLAITRSIVESHGGRVWAAANSGRGVTFYFTLPA
jgi:PAS domain S-box-containing protein